MEHYNKYIVTVCAAIWGWIYPSLWYIIVALLFIIVDNISAYKCNKRVKSKYPDQCKSSKYSSQKAWKTVNTMGITMLIIVISWALETHIISHFSDIKITAIISFIICAVTALSILENWSTANDNAPRWLTVIRKFLVDKTERYLNVDINEDDKIGDSK